jgi:UDP-GlcNAc:undecaprenyl-phosphate GlcNAc-1-phosphate transferase
MRVAERRPVTQGGRDHSSHRLVYTGLSEKRAVVLLVAVSAAAGLTSLAYGVLDNARITAVGVLVTFALLVELAMFLADAGDGEKPAHPFARHARVLGELVVDGAMVAASAYLAWIVVVEGDGTTWQRHVFLVWLPFLLACTYAALLFLGLYRPSRPRAGLTEALRVVVAVGIAAAAAYGLTRWAVQLADYPTSIFLLGAAFAAVLVAAGRFGERLLVSVVALARSPRSALRRSRAEAR